MAKEYSMNNLTASQRSTRKPEESWKIYKDIRAIFPESVAVGNSVFPKEINRKILQLNIGIGIEPLTTFGLSYSENFNREFIIEQGAKQ